MAPFTRKAGTGNGRSWFNKFMNVRTHTENMMRFFLLLVFYRNAHIFVRCVYTEEFSNYDKFVSISVRWASILQFHFFHYFLIQLIKYCLLVTRWASSYLSFATYNQYLNVLICRCILLKNKEITIIISPLLLQKPVFFINHIFKDR